MLLFKKSSFPVVHGSEGKETKRLEEKDREGETRRVKGGGKGRERERERVYEGPVEDGGRA